MCIRDSRYTGVVQADNASTHVNHELPDQKRDDKKMEILLDELVSTAQDVRALGIEVGDYALLDPVSYTHLAVYKRQAFM